MCCGSLSILDGFNEFELRRGSQDGVFSSIALVESQLRVSIEALRKDEMQVQQEEQAVFNVPLESSKRTSGQARNPFKGYHACPQGFSISWTPYLSRQETTRYPNTQHLPSED